MEPELGGGSLYDVGCYPVNFAGMITGSVPVSIAAKAEFQNGVDVLLSSILQYQNGTIANLNCGFNAYDRVFSEIIGTKGILEIPDTFSGNSGTIILTTETGRQEINVVESDRYLLEVEDFADAVINNRQPLFSLEETIRNMEVIDRLLELIRSQPH
jgi:predicted dehydrogenase